MLEAVGGAEGLGVREAECPREIHHLQAGRQQGRHELQGRIDRSAEQRGGALASQLGGAVLRSIAEPSCRAPDAGALLDGLALPAVARHHPQLRPGVLRQDPGRLDARVARRAQHGDGNPIHEVRIIMQAYAERKNIPRTAPGRRLAGPLDGGCRGCLLSCQSGCAAPALEQDQVISR